MRLITKLLCGLLLPLMSIATNAQVQPVSADIAEVISLSDEAQLLIISESNLLSDVMQIPEWEPYRTVVDIPSDKSLWVRFRVDNSLDTSKNLTLIAGNSFVDMAQAYILDEQGRILQSSRLNDDANKTTQFIRRGFEMQFVSQMQSEFTVYLLIRDDGISLLPIELWNSEAHKENRVKRLILIGALCGGLSLLSIHFLLAYILKNLPARFWFCIFSTAAMTTLLSAEGILPILFNLPFFAAELTAVSLVVTLFSALKITKIFFVPVPSMWWYFLYTLLLIPVANLFWLDDFYQIISILALAVFFILNKLLATVLYWKSIDVRSAIIYFAGWAALTVMAVIEFATFIHTEEHLFFSAPYPFIISCLGVLLVGVAIISREQSLITELSQGFTDTISAMHRFQDLFDNSVEGQLIARLSGEILAVNPAFSALFGYKQDKDWNDETIHLRQFFANSRDVDLLLGELSIQKVVLGKEVRAVTKEGSEFWLSITAKVDIQDDENLVYGSIFDVTERRLHHINLQYLNTHDQLTGLFNRRYFLELLQTKMSENATTDSVLGILLIDVDKFNSINHSCGHNAGDMFIKQIALALYNVIGDQYPLARIHSDQFGLLMDCESRDDIIAVGEKLVNQICDFEFKWEKRLFNQSISIGVALYDEPSSTPAELLSFADTACSVAKKESGTKKESEHKVHVYSSNSGVNKTIERELFWNKEVISAIINDSFVLFYQHYRPLNSNNNDDYFEVLVRLRANDGELVTPQFFLGNAEKNFISQKIDKWVVESFFSWLRESPKRLSRLGRANINLSSCAIVDDDFSFFLMSAFKKYDIPFEKICFDITESTAILNVKATQTFITKFQQYGCLFAIDNFGSGFSSYAYLKSLPVDFLKIDGNFIREIMIDKIDMAMVSSICDVARSMNIRTIAECVESQEILVQVGKLGIDYAQGFFLASPEPLQNFSQFPITSK